MEMTTRLVRNCSLRCYSSSGSLTEHRPANNLVAKWQTCPFLQGESARSSDESGKNDKTDLNACQSCRRNMRGSGLT